MKKKITQEKNKYFRVTEVLSAFSGLDKIPSHIVENAGRRGTKVHGVCESIIKGLGEWGVDEEIAGYIASFKQWWNTGIKVLSVEQRFYCDTLRITGQVDLIIETPEGSAILDFKTSYKESKTWPLQGSAYKYLANQAGYDIKKIQFLHLNKLGDKPRLIEYEDQFDLYKKCLDVHTYFNSKN